jgi:hypothetical protein
VCKICRDSLVKDLTSLPQLYSDCTGDAAPAVVRVVRRTSRKSRAADSICPAAADVRSTIRGVLASWAGLVTDERRLVPPARDVPTLARFLRQHVAWLVRHPAASDMVEEIRDLTRTARTIAYPDSVRRVHIGGCPDGDCEGDLVALIRRNDDLPSEIVCTDSEEHSWPITRWTTLARRVRDAEKEALKA